MRIVAEWIHKTSKEDLLYHPSVLHQRHRPLSTLTHQPMFQTVQSSRILLIPPTYPTRIDQQQDQNRETLQWQVDHVHPMQLRAGHEPYLQTITHPLHPQPQWYNIRQTRHMQNSMFSTQRQPVRLQLQQRILLRAVDTQNIQDAEREQWVSQ